MKRYFVYTLVSGLGLVVAGSGCREKQNVLTVETPDRKVEVNVEKEPKPVKEVEIEVERKNDD